MPFVIKLLGAGVTNAGSVTGLYTTSATALEAIVSNVRLVNTGGSSVTVNLFFKPSGGSQIRIWDKDKSVLAGDILVAKPELTMAPSDAIEVTTSAAMDFVVCGMEKV